MNRMWDGARCGRGRNNCDKGSHAAGVRLAVLMTLMLLMTLGMTARAQDAATRTDCDTQTGLRGDGAGCSQNAPGVDVRSAQAGTGDAVSLPRLNSPATRGSEDERSKAAERIEARSAQRAARLRPQPRSEYEVLVEKVTGRRLPIYGQSLFVEPPSTFAPLEQSPVPGDYIVGPGDELQVRIWGQLNADLRVTVDRAGEIYIPKVGELRVAGVRASQLDARLHDEVGRLFRNFSLTVNLGRIRSIEVYVVGQAREPGTYTVSSLSTLVNAIFASGGPSAAGSLRDIQVQREGKTVSRLDLYELLVKGDKSGDVRLESGDVIYYPPAGAMAAVTGSVKAPAIYELKAGERLEDLLHDAGGLATTADAGRVTLERLLEQEKRTVMEFPLDAESRGMKLHDGDIVKVLGAVPRLEQSVTLRGSVVRPGNYPWHPGMKVRDLIPDGQSLLTREYWMRRLTAGTRERPTRGAGNGVRGEQSWAQRGFGGNGLDEEQSAASRGGEARGERAAEDSGASGSTHPAGTTEARSDEDEAAEQSRAGRQLTEELHRTTPEINWSYAIIQRVNPVDLSSRLVPFDLGRAVLAGDAANNLTLEPGDIVTIFSQADLRVPLGERTRYVRVEGEVRRPGVYQVASGEGLREVLERAGGLTANAYAYGTQLTRESARREQQKSLDELARSLEAELRRAAAGDAAHGGEDAQLMRERQSAQQGMIAQLRAATASGRVVLNLSPAANSLGAFPALEMEDNDQVMVPARPSTVSVMGMVYNAGSFVYEARRTVGDYLKLAGRGRADADMHHAFVLHADGSVTASTVVNGAFSGDRFSSLRMRPGDQIVVPSRVRSGGLLRGLRDWTQISSQLALTGAAVAILR